MKKIVVKRLIETKVGDATMQIGLTVVFVNNEEEWKGRITDIQTLYNGKILYEIENAVSGSGKARSFTLQRDDITKFITDLEIEYGFYG